MFVVVRQVYEEIGFDVSPLIVEADYVETIPQQQQQRTKLFIIPGVSEEVAPLRSPSALLLTPVRADRLRASNAEGDQFNRLALALRLACLWVSLPRPRIVSRI